MTAIVDVSINDAQTTPVAHVFKHKSHSATELVLADSTAGLQNLARPIISISRLPSKDKNVRKLRVRTSIPVMETVSGNNAAGYVAEPRKIGESFAVTDYIVHGRTSEQGLKDLLAFHSAFCAANNNLFIDPYLNDRANY